MKRRALMTVLALEKLLPQCSSQITVHYVYTSQDDKITSDALSRCQKNQKNPGPGPRDLSRQRHIFRSPGCAASGGQHCEPCVRWLAEERSLR